MITAEQTTARQAAQLEFLNRLHTRQHEGRPADCQYLVEECIPALIPYWHCALWVIHEHAHKATMVAQAGEVLVTASQCTMKNLSDCDTWRAGRDPAKFQFHRAPDAFPPDAPADKHLRNQISIPVFAANQELHAQVIVYPEDQSDAFTPDEALFKVVTDHVSRYTEHSNRATELHLRDGLLKAGGRATDPISYAGEVGELLAKHIPCEGWSIFLFDKSSNRLKLADTSGLKGDPDPEEVSYELGDKQLTAKIAVTRTARNVADLADIPYEREDPPMWREKLWHPTKSYLAVPILDTNFNLGGVLRLRNRIERYSEEVDVFWWFDEKLAMLAARLSGAHLEIRTEAATRSRMLFLLTHEVENPAAFIKHTSQRLHQNFGQLPMQMVIKELRDIQNDADFLIWLQQGIKLFLTTPEERQRQYKFGKHSLREMLDRLNSSAMVLGREYHRSARRTVHIELPEARVQCDREALFLLLFNLMRNAFKYSTIRGESVGDIRISGWTQTGYECEKCNNTYAQAVVITVSDEGIGIPEAKEEYIFEPGVHLPDAVKQAAVQGVGLGLAIARVIAGDHAGCIHVSSRKDPTRFRLILPRVLY